MAKGKPRKDLRRIDLARRGLVVVVVLLLLLTMAYLRVTGSLGGDPVVSAQVRNAGGALRPGSDVKIAGVIVGRVKSIGVGDDGLVKVTMSMPDDRLDEVPDNVVARILPATVFGTTFVDLVVYDKPSGEHLEADDAIPADTTQGTLELQQALDDIDRLVTALGPAELNSAISSAAAALQGRGEKIGRTIDVADAYLGRVTPLLPTVRTDLRKLAENLEIVDELAPDLLDATDDGLVTLDTVVQQRAAISAIITGGTTLVRQTRGFLDATERRAIRMLDNGVLLLDVLYDNRRAGITDAISTNLLLGRELPTIVKEGFLQAEGPLRTTEPPYYTAADRPSFGSGRSREATLRGLLDRGGR